jgi:hypothetical protein
MVSGSPGGRGSPPLLAREWPTLADRPGLAWWVLAAAYLLVGLVGTRRLHFTSGSACSSWARSSRSASRSSDASRRTFPRRQDGLEVRT